jgi:hypothetical protein
VCEMMQMEGVVSESSGILLLASVESEVVQGNDGCNGHILNKWNM